MYYYAARSECRALLVGETRAVVFWRRTGDKVRGGFDSRRRARKNTSMKTTAAPQTPVIANNRITSKREHGKCQDREKDQIHGS
jgi:hypothetical protein